MQNANYVDCLCTLSLSTRSRLCVAQIFPSLKIYSTKTAHGTWFPYSQHLHTPCTRVSWSKQHIHAVLHNVPPYRSLYLTGVPINSSSFEIAESTQTGLSQSSTLLNVWLFRIVDSVATGCYRNYLLAHRVGLTHGRHCCLAQLIYRLTAINSQAMDSHNTCFHI